MYDSENSPLSTRIEAGTGVAITYSTNSDGEGVYVASIDSDYLVSLVTVNAGGTLTLNATDEARLAAVEAKLGISGTSTTPTPSASSGTAGTTEVDIEVNGSINGETTAGTSTTITYSIVAIDGTTLITESMTASGGSSATVLELGIFGQMKRNAGITKRVTPTYVDGKLILTWTEDQVGSTFKTEITSKHANDTITVAITDY